MTVHRLWDTACVLERVMNCSPEKQGVFEASGPRRGEFGGSAWPKTAGKTALQFITRSSHGTGYLWKGKPEGSSWFA